MIIRWIGHSCFMLTSTDGTMIVTDPFDESVKCVFPSIEPDAVTVSHQHHDHNAVSRFGNSPRVFSEYGSEDEIFPEIKLRGFLTYHDDEKGAKRGENIVYMMEIDGIRVLHLGDLGCSLDEDTIAEIGRVDVLMIPVGGFFTMDAETAARITKRLSPSVVIPMHYKNESTDDWQISDEKQYLDMMGYDAAQTVEALRIMPEDLTDQPECALFAPAFGFSK
ncbi:MAG: MBL fold metallo-hydrolase [Eubacteriales bacterium]|nr:MBL fold metallo-hydrolase [Eubacteriales bacterium]MDD3881527.1 MBL fold metallo-hydrolase [Eubacteriales bacterium]MDD4512991.1 MBL fold metallo-hydrolase [Eubacteriales bacterium]